MKTRHRKYRSAPNRPKRLWPRYPVALLMLAAPALQADEGAELEKLRQQIEQLKSLRHDYDRRLEILEERLLREEELAVRGRGTPAGPPVAAEPEGTAPAMENPPAADATVKDPPASKSAQAVYEEQHSLFGRKFTLETGLTYSHFDRKQLVLNGFLALDAIFLGEISVDEVSADILTLDILGRWGLSNRLQVDLAAPFLYRRTKYQSGGAGGSAAALSEEEVKMSPEFQVGDVSAGLYYQLKPETATSPDIVWNLRLKAPTGSHPYGIETVQAASNLTVPKELPSGNGIWALSTGFSFIKTVDPAILFANVGYFYNHPRSFDDIDSTPGPQPGSIKLGDSFQYGLGIAFALSERTSMSFAYTQRFSEKSKTKLEGGEWQKVIGSDANAASFNVGVTHALGERASMVTNLGVGLTPDAPDVQLSLKFPYSF